MPATQLPGIRGRMGYPISVPLLLLWVLVSKIPCVDKAVSGLVPNANTASRLQDGGVLFADSRPFRFQLLHLERRIAELMSERLYIGFQQVVFSGADRLMRLHVQTAA